MPGIEGFKKKKKQTWKQNIISEIEEIWAEEKEFKKKKKGERKAKNIVFKCIAIISVLLVIINNNSAL